MKHNSKRNIICKRLFFLGIFLDNINVPPSQKKCLLGESRNTRYDKHYSCKPNGYAAGVLGTSTRRVVVPNQKYLSNCCIKALSHWQEMKNSERCAPWNFTKKYCPKRATHCAFIASKSATPTIVSNIFANSQAIFRFRFFSKKKEKNPHSLQQSS